MPRSDRGLNGSPALMLSVIWGLGITFDDARIEKQAFKSGLEAGSKREKEKEREREGVSTRRKVRRRQEQYTTTGCSNSCGTEHGPSIYPFDLGFPEASRTWFLLEETTSTTRRLQSRARCERVWLVLSFD